MGPLAAERPEVPPLFLFRVDLQGSERVGRRMLPRVERLLHDGFTVTRCDHDVEPVLGPVGEAAG